MSLVVDSGGVTALAADRSLVRALRAQHLWPPLVPAVVLAEALTGDHRRDVRTNRLLRTCAVRPVEEPHSREAARLRTATGRAGSISAVDGVVAEAAGRTPGSVVLTGDVDDLEALAEHARHRFVVRRV